MRHIPLSTIFDDSYGVDATAGGSEASAMVPVSREVLSSPSVLQGQHSPLDHIKSGSPAAGGPHDFCR